VSASVLEGSGSGAAVRDTITHNSKARRGRGMTMSLDTSSDLAAPAGSGQHGSTLPRRETLISHCGTCRDTHWVRSTGHGRDQKEQPTPTGARAARARKKPKQERAHVQDPQYTIVGSSQQPWKQHHPPRGAGSCLLSQIPPDLQLPYLPRCLPFCFACLRAARLFWQ
jgi:hypothetical protein